MTPNCEDDVDLNSQPTMIAYKGDAIVDEYFVSEKQVAGAEDQNAMTDGSVDEDEVVGGRPVEERLSRFVDLFTKSKADLNDNASNDNASISLGCMSESCREDLRALNFKELVSSEVVKFGINQHIFAKTVLSRSQGYLSDLLNHQQSILCMTDQSRMLTNFIKIRAFLALDDMDRRSRYLHFVKEAVDEEHRIEAMRKVKISPRKKRMTFSKDVKEELRMIFKDRKSMPSQSELLGISERLSLEVATIKNFFRNFRARSRLR